MGRALFWKVGAFQNCAAETPLQLIILALVIFFFMYWTTTCPLLSFLSWTHLSLPLTLCAIYVCRQLLDVRKLSYGVSRGFVSLRVAAEATAASCPSGPQSRCLAARPPSQSSRGTQ